ncbi:MAG: hypothetical protein JO360_11310 [Acidobacteria bacterium]|nr:hypothetical protein [Acidobacteriota bacterium]
MAGLLAGLLLAWPLSRPASAPVTPTPDSTPFEVACLSPAELETLALDVLSALNEKKGALPPQEFGAAQGDWMPLRNDPKQVRQGIRNARRLLSLAKKFTIESLMKTGQTGTLSKEKRLIEAMRHIVLDPQLVNTAEVSEGDLSKIYVSPDYAATLVSDDEAVLMLGHELTHVAVRTGRLHHLIENVNQIARQSASLELSEDQQEELACDFIGAEVLKRYIALAPTAEPNAERFARVFGYLSPAERLALAWQNFCDSYNGAAWDEQHLSQDQTFRALLGLDPELRALIPADASAIQLCR